MHTQYILCLEIIRHVLITGSIILQISGSNPNTPRWRPIELARPSGWHVGHPYRHSIACLGMWAIWVCNLIGRRPPESMSRLVYVPLNPWGSLPGRLPLFKYRPVWIPRCLCHKRRGPPKQVIGWGPDYWHCLILGEDVLLRTVCSRPWPPEVDRCFLCQTRTMHRKLT